MGFIEDQAQAWRTIVTLMLKDPRNIVVNGSINGPGSSRENTRNIREELPGLLRSYGISTMLDAPCGDFGWMCDTPLDFLYSYVGIDVERRLIEANQQRCAADSRVVFICANLLTRKRLPRMDVILCRDFLMSLTDEHLLPLIEKFRASGSTYLLASNYAGAPNTFDYHPEDFPLPGYLERPYDLTGDPFNLVRVAGIEEQQAPNGVVSLPHELALFKL